MHDLDLTYMDDDLGPLKYHFELSAIGRKLQKRIRIWMAKPPKKDWNKNAVNITSTKISRKDGSSKTVLLIAIVHSINH